jgi:hypothetical protein
MPPPRFETSPNLSVAPNRDYQYTFGEFNSKVVLTKKGTGQLSVFVCHMWDCTNKP